ncbi:MAG: FAD:protein FMN transferase [Clostridia bacterium]|nr:FAD:protein FMN transferase [Clostridia bacterium]
MEKAHFFGASKKWLALILCGVIILGIIAADFFINREKSEKTYVAMGTVITSKIQGKGSAEAEEEIRTMINGMETACLSWRCEGSDVYRINEHNGTFESVSQDTAKWIADCVDVSEKSSGAFDITIGKVTKLWNFDGESSNVPSSKEIEKALQAVDYSKMLFNSTAVKIAKGQFIDLGAVGKGIACDSAREILENSGVKSATVSVGGSVLVFGKSATVGVICPDDDTKCVGTINLKDKCVSTSGDYERFFEKDGKKYHHILDPYTGYPVENNLRSVTVICDSGLLSDALSTACFVLGYKGSLGLLNNYDAEAIYIFDDNTIAVTDGVKSFKLTDNSYKMK